MGKSARVLGWEFGRTAREMNGLLKEHGYLFGEPGAYGLTEKGKQYAEEQYNARGTGGYAHYNRNWETRTWNDQTAAALRVDMEADPSGFDAGVSPAEEEHTFGYESSVDYFDTGEDDPQPSWKAWAIGGALIGALLIAPHVKPFWNNKLKPAAKKMRDRMAKQESVECTDP